MIVAAGNSLRGREFAARNADMMFTNPKRGHLRGSG
ncbi:MAG: hypothetical protein CM1200mP27_00560 [Chloroflexota bacterium]|nr:MAG: hypothetical protein CM1200mP27_00560 [Chloroflexota bacterium]